MKKIVYLMVGPAGAGKTTWIKNHIQEGGLHVSRDEIRLSFVGENKPYFSAEKKVESTYYSTIYREILFGKANAIYADATHLTEKSRRKFIESVFPFGIPLNVEIVPVVFENSLMTCIKHNCNRKGRFHVPESVIARMYNQMTDPVKDKFADSYTRYIRVKVEDEDG